MLIKNINGTLFKNIFKILNEFVTHVTLRFTDKGIKLDCTDISCIIFISLFLSYRDILEIDIDDIDINSDNIEERDDISVDIDISLINKLLTNNVKANVLINIKYDLNDSDKITFTFHEEDDEDYYREFNIKLINIEGELLQCPEVDYPCKVTMDAIEFKSIFTSSLDSEQIEFMIRDEQLLFIINNDMYDTKIRSKYLDMKCNEDVKLSFAFKELMKMSKTSTITDTVIINLSNEYPLLLEYKFENSYINYYLAPKICDDNDIDICLEDI